ncbi:cytochrome P450 [Armillaria borealis]|uniref:Cytochrome P450 n=1 Tax=Armillaria borealis TaxID=47425 RepID=A0AA39JJK3_9AGAR|nr:cytochrome P450 [Armillaria borealis]
MPYLNAVLKEILRFHPISYNSPRFASRDDVLPLSKSMMMKSGKVLHDLLIPKGTCIITSIACYNRNKDVFRADAHTFNLERWLENGDIKRNAKVSLGLYGNLFTFFGGPQSCMGWRFALLSWRLLTNLSFPDRGLDSHSEGIVQGDGAHGPHLKGEVEKRA